MDLQFDFVKKMDFSQEVKLIATVNSSSYINLSQSKNFTKSFFFLVISCTEIVGLENGSVRCTGGGRYNSVCNHACNPGFQLIGVSTRRCLATGDWSNTAPVCES